VRILCSAKVWGDLWGLPRERQGVEGNAAKAKLLKRCNLLPQAPWSYTPSPGF